MTDYNRMPVFELIYVIVNYGMGSRILHKAKEYGIPGGTVFLGKGTVNNALLNFLSLYDERKEIVILGTDAQNVVPALTGLNKSFQFEKPNHGIVFTTRVCMPSDRALCGTKAAEEERRGDQPMYQIIFTIVNRGKAEEVVEAAQAAGAKGGTIMNARGSGIHETTRLFNMDIEPEKEMVMILAKESTTDGIVSSIREALEIDKPGNGIIFVQNVEKAYGVYE